MIRCQVTVVFILRFAEHLIKFSACPADDPYSIPKVGDHTAPRVALG